MKPIDCYLPEAMLVVAPGAPGGVPIDAITAAIARADAVLYLLSGQFSGDPGERYCDAIIANALWDVQGTLGLIKTLVLHADATAPRPAPARARQ